MSQPRTPRRRVLTAAATVAAVIALSGVVAGCGEDQSSTDFAPVSNTEYNPVNGISLDSTYVHVRNLYLLAPAVTRGTLAPLPRLRMTMVNPTLTGDELVGATVGAPVAVAGRLVGGTGGSVRVPADGSVPIGNAGGLQITFSGIGALPGSWVPVTLLFRSGAAVTGSMPVQDLGTLTSDGTLPGGGPLVVTGG